MELLQLLIYGVVLGSVIALGAIGVSLTFGILGFANFSHGDLMSAGAYVALVFFTTLSWPLWIALPIAATYGLLELHAEQGLEPLPVSPYPWLAAFALAAQPRMVVLERPGPERSAAGAEAR